MLSASRKRQSGPPRSAFPHGAECRTLDAQPEWERVDRVHWQRTCSCHVQHWYASEQRPPPPDASVLHHGVDENGDPCRTQATVKWDSDGGYWQVRCRGCGVSVTVVPYRRAGDEPLPVNAMFSEAS
jgi:hypothetical protein